MEQQLLRETRTGLRLRWHWVFPAAAGVFLLALVQPPVPIFPEGFDSSWRYALNQQQELGVRFGRDVLHVWGPTAIWMAPWLKPAHVIGYLIWCLVLHGAIIAAMAGITLRANRPFACTLILLIAAWLLPGAVTEPAIYGAVLLLVVADLLAPRWYFFLPAAAIAAVFAIAKFNVFIGLTAVALLHGLGSWYTQGRSWRPAAWRLGVFIVSLAAAAFVGFGSPAAFAHWMRGGWDLATGNSEALSLPVDLIALGCGLAMGLLLATMIWPLWQKAGRRVALSWAALAAVLFYLSFKHGYVRGGDHLSYFHQGIVLVGASGLLIAGGRRMLILMLLMTITGAAGLHFAGVRLSPAVMFQRARFPAVTMLCRTTGRWNRYQANQDRWVAEAADRAAPLRHQLTGHTADVIPWDTTWLEGLSCTWSPAPYFQMSLIRSRSGDQANAAHYAGPKAPERLLLSLKDIDDRHLMHTAPLAMEAILGNYHHFAADGSTVILERGARWKWVHQPLGQQNVRWGEPIEIPPSDDIVAVKIRAWRSQVGKLQKVLYRIPPVMIEIENHPRYRFLSSTAVSGIWVKGLPRTTAELDLLLQTGRPAAETLRTRSFRIIQGPEDACFLPEVMVEFEGIRAQSIPEAMP